MEDRLTDRPSSGPLFTRLLVFGNTATAIKNPESDHTHRWTVYVRGFNGEDISPYVRKVAFRLHESFLQPTRVVDKAPFEVSETGWGEFQIQIRVFFHEAPEKPVVLQHNLRLYMAGEDLDAQLKNSGKPVISEHIDEVVFDPPPAALIPVLESVVAASDYSSSSAYKQLLEAEKQELAKLNVVLAAIEGEMASLK